MGIALIKGAGSTSFPEAEVFPGPLVDAADADVVIVIGDAAYRDAGKKAVVVEIGNRFLAEETGLSAAADDANVLGFSRYRNGADAPSKLVEIVRAGWTSDDTVAAARAAFETAGFTVAVCTDQPGRIVDRLVRPKYNAALRFLDEGLATQVDMDLTCRMGLGYPDGPVERVLRGGLAYHHEVTKALFEATGAAGYAPPRAAIVAARGVKART
jgi:3-hydroxybutyryl-CoA dehydrogenase